MKIIGIDTTIVSLPGGPSVSGGDIRFIEILKRWAQKGHDIHVLVTPVGKELCEELGLLAKYYLSKPAREISVKTYFVSLLESMVVPHELCKLDGGIIYTSSEYLQCSLPALYLKKKGKNFKWAAVVYAHIKKSSSASPFDWMIRQINIRFIRRYADVVLGGSAPTCERLKKMGINSRKLYVVNSGVNFHMVKRSSTNVKIKRFDAIYIKRFSMSDALFDMIKIWKKVVTQRKNAKLGIIGTGNEKILSKLKSTIKSEKLEMNIDLLGVVSETEKYTLLAESKIFVLPTYEEAWGIVIGEALASGVPTIVYALDDIRYIWKDKVIWVPVGDIDKFASEIIKLLDNEQMRIRLSKEGKIFMEKYDWDKIADTELKYIIEGLGLPHTL